MGIDPTAPEVLESLGEVHADRGAASGEVGGGDAGEAVHPGRSRRTGTRKPRAEEPGIATDGRAEAEVVRGSGEETREADVPATGSDRLKAELRKVADEIVAMSSMGLTKARLSAKLETFLRLGFVKEAEEVRSALVSWEADREALKGRLEALQVILQKDERFFVDALAGHPILQLFGKR